MSFSRANVVWQSPDGSWNQAFWLEVEPESEDDSEEFDEGQDEEDVESDDEFDDEHDVEYADAFAYATTGHPDEESAWRTAVRDDPWHSNPGGSHRLTLSNSTEAERAELEALAATCPHRVPYTPVGR